MEEIKKEIEKLNSRLDSIEEALKLLLVRETITDVQSNIDLDSSEKSVKHIKKKDISVNDRVKIKSGSLNYFGGSLEEEDFSDTWIVSKIDNKKATLKSNGKSLIVKIENLEVENIDDTEKETEKNNSTFKEKCDKENKPEYSKYDDEFSENDLFDIEKFFDKLEQNNDFIPSKSKQKRMFEKLLNFAENGDGLAQCILGNCYYYGIYVEANDDEAMKWYNEASVSVDASSPMVTYRLGEYYDSITDYKQAMLWYKKAAEQNYIPALYEIAWYYGTGRGVLEDEETMIYYYKKIDDLDDGCASDEDIKLISYAQEIIGNYYLRERNNTKEAVKYYEKSAENKNGQAACKLSMEIYTMKAIACNNEKNKVVNNLLALEWWLKYILICSENDSKKYEFFDKTDVGFAVSLMDKGKIADWTKRDYEFLSKKSGEIDEEECFDKIIEIMSEQFDISVNMIDMLLTIEDLEIDSLTMKELYTAIEKEFNVRISDYERENFYFIRDIVDYIIEKNQ